MNQKRKNAFTLIELLAVIVILAIIALIAIPVIMNIINKVNRSAFKDTAYGIINAGELYFAEQQLEPNGMLQDVTIPLPDSRLELKGKVPEGEILITKDGNIAIAVYNNRYCVTKGFDDTDVTVTEDYEACELPNNQNNNSDGSVGDKSSNEFSVDINSPYFMLNIGDASVPLSKVSDIIMSVADLKASSYIIGGGTDKSGYDPIGESVNEMLLIQDNSGGFEGTVAFTAIWLPLVISVNDITTELGQLFPSTGTYIWNMAVSAETPEEAEQLISTLIMRKGD